MQAVKTLVIAGLIIIAASSVHAQQPSPQPTVTPSTQTGRTAQDLAAERQAAADQRRLDAEAQDRMRAGLERDVDRRKRAVEAAIGKLYRRSTEAEHASLAPDAEVARRYADSLRRLGTALIKLAPDAGCTNDTAVVSASAECLVHSMPGGGNSYSFRARDYRVRRLADITLSKDRFEITGFLTHGIFVDLGKIPIETLTLATGGAPYVTELQPAKDLVSAKRIEDTLRLGVDAGGFHYASSVRVSEGSTYLLRTIAYRAESLRAYEGVVYDEFSFDSRSDGIVAFTVVARGSDGSVTLLWKELSRKQSPKLKLK